MFVNLKRTPFLRVHAVAVDFSVKQNMTEEENFIKFDPLFAISMVQF